MSYEDDYIDYVAEHRTGFLGGLAHEGLQHLTSLGIIGLETGAQMAKKLKPAEEDFDDVHGPFKRSRKTQKRKTRKQKVTQFAKAYGMGRKKLKQVLQRTKNETKADLKEANVNLYTRLLGLQEEIRQLTPNPFIWKTADGRHLRPSEMDEQHLRNTVSFLQRKLTVAFGSVRFLQQTAWMVEALNEMFKECKRRGYEV